MKDDEAVNDEAVNDEAVNDAADEAIVDLGVPARVLARVAPLRAVAVRVVAVVGAIIVRLLLLGRRVVVARLCKGGCGERRCHHQRGRSGEENTFHGPGLLVIRSRWGVRCGCDVEITSRPVNCAGRA